MKKARRHGGGSGLGCCTKNGILRLLRLRGEYGICKLIGAGGALSAAGVAHEDTDDSGAEETGEAAKTQTSASDATQE